MACANANGYVKLKVTSMLNIDGERWVIAHAEYDTASKGTGKREVNAKFRKSM